ncbi:MAG: hypothetical protein ACTS6P_00915 [Candidatus Hodgkinia cicadicola]
MSPNRSIWAKNLSRRREISHFGWPIWFINTSFDFRTVDWFGKILRRKKWTSALSDA